MSLADLTYTKIVVGLPDAEGGVSGEGLWTKHLYGDVYEVHNSPWHSREVNFLDHVEAIAPSADHHPRFVRVVHRSGHRTIHVIFLQRQDSSQAEVLRRINELGGTYEGADHALYAIDVKSPGSWQGMLTYLEEQAKVKMLEYRWSAY
jgi:hypothetical protein